MATSTASLPFLALLLPALAGAQCARSTTTLAEKCTEKLVEEFNFLRV